MEVSNEILWLIAGVILILLEFTVIPGVGMLFAGVAAIIVGTIVEPAGISVTYQLIIFLAATSILTILFYKPLKYFHRGTSASYNDIVGQSATVIEILGPGDIGRVKWSGTVMKAKVCPSCTTIFAENAIVRIVGLEGNILVVKG